MALTPDEVLRAGRRQRARALEDELLLQLAAAGLPEPVREHRFAPPRRWRFDFAWPEARLAVEVEGGTWVRGRHVRPRGYEADCRKYNAAALAGWRVLRVTAAMVRSGEAARLVAEALGCGFAQDGEERCSGR